MAEAPPKPLGRTSLSLDGDTGADSTGEPLWQMVMTSSVAGEATREPSSERLGVSVRTGEGDRARGATSPLDRSASVDTQHQGFKRKFNIILIIITCPLIRRNNGCTQRDQCKM